MCCTVDTMKATTGWWTNNFASCVHSISRNSKWCAWGCAYISGLRHAWPFTFSCDIHFYLLPRWWLCCSPFDFIPASWGPSAYIKRDVMQPEEESHRAPAARMRTAAAAASTPLQAFTPPTAAAEGRSVAVAVGPDAAAVEAEGGRAAAKQVALAPRRSRGTSERTASSKFAPGRGGTAVAAAGEDENGEAEGAPHTKARGSTAVAAAVAEAPRREIRCRALLAAAQDEGSANVKAEEVIAALPRSVALSRGVRRAVGTCAAGIRADEQHTGIAARCGAAEGEAEELSGGAAAVFSNSGAAHARAGGKAVVAPAEAAGQSGAATANADGIGRLAVPTGFTSTFFEWWRAGRQWKHKGSQQNQAAACLRVWRTEQSTGRESRRMQEIILRRKKRDEGVAATSRSDAAAEVPAIVKANVSLPVFFTRLCGGRMRRYATDAALSSFRESKFSDLQSEGSPASAIATGTAATPRIAGAAEATTDAVDRGIAQVNVLQEASGTRGVRGSVAARAVQKKGPDEKAIEKSSSSLFRRERGWPAEKRERLRRRFNQCKRLHAFLRSSTCMHNVLSNSFLEATGGLSYSDAIEGSVVATSNCQAPTAATALVHAHPLRGKISSVYGSAPAHDEEASAAAVISSTTAEANAKRGLSDQAGVGGDAEGARNENAAAEVNEEPGAAAATTMEDLDLCTRGEFSVAVSVLSTYSKLLLQEQQRVEQDEDRSSDIDSSFPAATTQAHRPGADVPQGAVCRARSPAAAAAAQRDAAASMQLLDPTALLLPPLFLHGRRRQPFLITSGCGLPLKHTEPLSADTNGNRQQLSPQRRAVLEQDKRLPAVEPERQTPEKRKLQLQSSCIAHGCHDALPQCPPADSHSHTASPHRKAVNNNANKGIKEEQLQSIARATSDMHALQQQQSTTAGATAEARQRKHQLSRLCHIHARQQYTSHKSRTGGRGAALEQQQKKQQQTGNSSGDGVVCQQDGGVDTRIRMNQPYDGVTPESGIYKKPSLARLVVICEDLKRRQQEIHVEAAVSNEFQSAGKLHLRRLQRHDTQQQQYKHSQRMEERKEKGNGERRKRREEQHSTLVLSEQHDELQKPDEMTENLIHQGNTYACHTHQHKEGQEIHAHLRYQQQWRQQSENSPSGGLCAAEEQHPQASQQQKNLPYGLRAERMPPWTQKRRGAVCLDRLRGLGGRRGFIVQQRQKRKRDRNARKEEAVFVEQYHARDAEEKKKSLVRGSHTDRRHCDVSMFQEHAKRVKRGRAGDTKQKRNETEELEERVYAEELRSYLLHRSRSLQHLELETILGNFLERHIYHFSLQQLHELHVLLHLDTSSHHSSSGMSRIHSSQKSGTSSNSEGKSSGAYIDSSNVNEYNFTETGSSTIIKRSSHYAFRSSSSHNRDSYFVGNSPANTLSDPAHTTAGGVAPTENAATSIQAKAEVSHLSSTERTDDEDSTVKEQGTFPKKESGVDITHSRHCGSSAASAGPGLARAAAEAEAPGRKYTEELCVGECTHSSADATAAKSGALRQRKSTYEKNGLLFALMTGAVQEVPGNLRSNSVLLLLLQYVFSDHPLLQQFTLRLDA